jgi:hypothetical protein
VPFSLRDFATALKSAIGRIHLIEWPFAPDRPVKQFLQPHWRPVPQLLSGDITGIAQRLQEAKLVSACFSDLNAGAVFRSLRRARPERLLVPISIAADVAAANAKLCR